MNYEKTGISSMVFEWEIAFGSDKISRRERLTARGIALCMG
jgi:hypothetical protein